MRLEDRERYLALLPLHPYLPTRTAYNLCSLVLPVGIVDDVGRAVGMGPDEIMPGLYEYRTFGRRYGVAGDDIRVAEKDCVMDLYPPEELWSRYRFHMVSSSSFASSLGSAASAWSTVAGDDSIASGIR